MADTYNPVLCDFSHAGTFGHECGAPATQAGKKVSMTGTKTGYYWVRRCPKCVLIQGGENTGVLEWAPFDPVAHRNEWR